MELSKSLESIVFNLNEKNFETSVQETINLFVDRLPYTFNYLVSRLIYSAFVSQSNNENIYIKYLLTLKEKEDEKDKNKSETEANLVQIFCEYLLKIEKQESYFLLEKMIEEKILEPSSVMNMNTLYFSQYKTKEEINKLRNKYPKPQFFEEFISALDELSKDDWKLHMQYVKEGVNPLEIAKVLRNDDLEKLQEISSNNEFDFNQIIESSLYERCSFINTKNVSLIDYVAFFGSIKCFKFLLLNNSNIKNTSKYAIAGGNLEIIHLCEQNNSSFTEAYETAIEFHQNEIFHYLYENKTGKISNDRKNSSPIFSFTKSNSNIENQDNCNLSEENLIYLGKKCIEFNNYEIFMFLEKEGMKINNEIIEEIASKGNTFIIESDIESQQIPKTILPYSVKSGNIEIVKLLLDKGIDVNARDIHLNNLKYVIII